MSGGYKPKPSSATALAEKVLTASNQSRSDVPSGTGVPVSKPPLVEPSNMPPAASDRDVIEIPPGTFH